MKCIFCSQIAIAQMELVDAVDMNRVFHLHACSKHIILIRKSQDYNITNERDEKYDV